MTKWRYAALVTALAGLSVPASAADGVLAGFGNVPFGMDLEAARAVPGIEIRDDSCDGNRCLLTYRTTVSDLNVSVFQQFVDNKATSAEVLVRSTGEGGRFTSTSFCEAAFNRVFSMLERKYGAADTPIVQRAGVDEQGVPVQVREVSFSFVDGAQVRERRRVFEDNTCSMRIFYKPPSDRAGDAQF